MSTLRKFALPLLLLALAFGIVGSGHKTDAGESTGYDILRTAPQTNHVNQSSADATTWAAPLNPQKTLGNPNAVAFVQGTATGSTCVVACGLYYALTPADAGYSASVTSYVYCGQAKVVTGSSATATMAGSGVTNGTGLVPALGQCIFDTAGCPFYDIRIAAPSSGEVGSVTQWCYGLASK